MKDEKATPEVSPHSVNHADVETRKLPATSSRRDEYRSMPSAFWLNSRTARGTGERRFEECLTGLDV
ncbi:hypothetical protein N7462_003714 [Penicillium macrosclerotiorum]|uniref:uncharacterized protein n=1 Tax=Penicillium macrosclerotiorum TaxID=303699 RepID=UPI002547CEC7|nr:uncharacterized protein N7462_003714 [Penicillium macrosclerotiorum]KAJ5689322.1 hypothetical protein N7462_003714 [Penicillium macrosclerotiorum]